MSTLIRDLYIERHVVNPWTGELFDERALARMTDEEKEQLVMLEGRAEDIDRISEAVIFMNREDRRAKNRLDNRHPRENHRR